MSAILYPRLHWDKDNGFVVLPGDVLIADIAWCGGLYECVVDVFVEQEGTVAEVDIADNHEDPEIEDVGDELAQHHLHTVDLPAFFSGLQQRKA